MESLYETTGVREIYRAGSPFYNGMPAVYFVLGMGSHLPRVSAGVAAGMIEAVDEDDGRVVITGGIHADASQWQLAPLVTLLLARGFRVTIETRGVFWQPIFAARGVRVTLSLYPLEPRNEFMDHCTDVAIYARGASTYLFRR